MKTSWLDPLNMPGVNSGFLAGPTRKLGFIPVCGPDWVFEPSTFFDMERTVSALSPKGG